MKKDNFTDVIEALPKVPVAPPVQQVVANNGDIVTLGNKKQSPHNKGKCIELIYSKYDKNNTYEYQKYSQTLQAGSV